ncbi:MAG: hypothetical protein JW803_06015 [Endomicrobiales bacterium]|nr:hypothetical protein [Endomicrobiales bacterium]
MYNRGIFTLLIVALIAISACHQNKTDIKNPPDNTDITVVQESTDTAKVDIPIPPNPPEPPAPIEQESISKNLTSDISADFLFSGKNPVQIGISSSTIVSQRACILRGRTLDSNNNPLTLVEITILDHPEYGKTVSQKEGIFDMAVNGGGYVTLCYKKEGFLPVQRMVYAPWQDFASLPDVVMIPVDANVTNVDLSSLKDMTIVQGSAKSDEDGKRQATLVMSAGVQAEMSMPDGSKKDLSAMRIRATEYTVGNNGPNAMPAELPPSSGYTYCVEYSVDEALDSGAADVAFSTPIYHYNENFLNFPVGSAVPAGYYDKQKGVWVASENGIVIKLLSISSDGKAEIDVNGSGKAASYSQLDKLNVTAEECVKLAHLYKPGQSFWRVPIKHFTPWDFNWPYGPPPDADKPHVPDPKPDNRQDDDCETDGSIIETKNQILKQRLPVPGTPFTLNYNSGNVQGNKTDRMLDLQLTSSTLPGSLGSVNLTIDVAGQHFEKTYEPPETNLSYTFEWDGFDAYARPVHGARKAVVAIDYVYKAVYQTPADFSSSFERFGGAEITGSKARGEVSLGQKIIKDLTSLDSRVYGLGAWTLDIHHFYDACGKVLCKGDGSRIHSDSTKMAMIKTIAGSGGSYDCEGYSGDGGPAAKAKLNFPEGIAIGADGSVYFADSSNHVVRKVNPDGIIITVAGNGKEGYSGDDGLAIKAQLHNPTRVAIHGDGTLYILDASNKIIRKVDPDGIISTYAGSKNKDQYLPSSFDGMPAINAYFYELKSIALAKDGTLYFSDHYGKIYRVNPEGILVEIRTNEKYNATEIAIDADGGIYFVTDTNLTIKKIEKNGRITKIAGTGKLDFSKDESVAADSPLYLVDENMVVDEDGTLYFCEDSDRVRCVTPDGIIKTVIGGGRDRLETKTSFLAKNVWILPNGIAVAPDGSIYVSDTASDRIARVSSGFPGFSNSDYLIASEDGTELYHFDKKGRHLRTIDRLSGKTKYEFGYDRGYLSKITDINGNITVIEHDSDGNPVAISSPFGVKTVLKTNSNSYLSVITNPNGESIKLGYTDTGLLTSLIDPKGNTHKFTYSNDGRLVKDENPLGGWTSLSRTVDANGFTVAKNTAEQRKAAYTVENLPNGDTLSTVEGCCGGAITTLTKTDGTQKINRPEGTIIETREEPDPVFGMQSPIDADVTIKTPQGLTYNEKRQRDVILNDSDNALSLGSQKDKLTINDKTYVSEYSSATRTSVMSTPERRKITLTYDDSVRPLSLGLYDLAVTSFSYDTYGRLSSLSRSDGNTLRESSLKYDSRGNVSEISGPLGNKAQYAYDSAGRSIKQILSDGREISYSYDSNGNVTSITPPGRPKHSFDYNAVDLRKSYAPPSVTGNPATTYEYNLEKEVRKIIRPDGKEVNFTYCPLGKIKTLNSLSCSTTFNYDAANGNLLSICHSREGGNPEVLNYIYDGSLLLSTGWSGTVKGSLIRYYDNNFWISSITVNGLAPLNFSYDSDGLLTSINDWRLSRNYDNGLIEGTRLGKVQDSFGYNNFGELTSYKTDINYSTVYRVSYARDAAGRIISSTETYTPSPSMGEGRGEGYKNIYNYNYDASGRLTEAYRNGTLASKYYYDSNSNRIKSVIPNAGEESYTYDVQDRLLSYGNNTYTYTPNGELTSKTSSPNAGIGDPEVTKYTYDELGNLRTVILPDGMRIDYVIYGQNRRIGKKVNGTLVKGWLYADGLTPIAELDGNNNVVSQFAGGLMLKDGKTYRIITDHLGSPRLVINSDTGEIAQRIEYGEFGNVTLDTNPGFQPFGFAGGLYDPDTKLVRFGARDYDAEIGRWTSKDPIDFAGGDTNLYGYCLNDPVNWMDKDGLDAVVFNDSIGPSPFGIKSGLGHNGVGVGNDRTGWDYYSKEGYEGWGDYNHYSHYDSYNEMLNDIGSRYDRTKYYNTSNEQDYNMRQQGTKELMEPYNAGFDNCADLVKDIIQAGGIEVPDSIINIPNKQFNKLPKNAGCEIK